MLLLYMIQHFLADRQEFRWLHSLFITEPTIFFFLLPRSTSFKNKQKNASDIHREKS